MLHAFQDAPRPEVMSTQAKALAGENGETLRLLRYTSQRGGEALGADDTQLLVACEKHDVLHPI